MIKPVVSTQELLDRIHDLENRLAESNQLLEAIKAGEVVAFAVASFDKPQVFTLETGDYAYRVLIEEFAEGAVNMTEDGMLVYCNTCFYEMIQLPYEKVIGCNITDFIHPDSKLEFARLFAESMLGNSKGEIRLLVNGRSIPVYVSLSSLRPTLATVG